MKTMKCPLGVELTDRLEIAGFDIFRNSTGSFILIDTKTQIVFKLCESSLRKRKADMPPSFLHNRFTT